jgi:hypothetical protein
VNEAAVGLGVVTGQAEVPAEGWDRHGLGRGTRATTSGFEGGRFMTQFLKLQDYWVNVDQIRYVLFHPEPKGNTLECDIFFEGESCRAFLGEDARRILAFLRSNETKPKDAHLG